MAWVMADRRIRIGHRAEPCSPHPLFCSIFVRFFVGGMFSGSMKG
jgi:hypothetical protein